MTVSNSKDFELDVAEYVEEAFERCGLEARTGYDLRTAKRSLNLMFADWANRGLNQWTIKQRTQTVTQGTSEYALLADVIDVLAAVVRRDGTDFTIPRIGRDAYLSIPTKTTTGRPTQFFLDRQITPNLKVWPVPDNSTDIIVYDCRRYGKYYGRSVQVLSMFGGWFGLLFIFKTRSRARSNVKSRVRRGNAQGYR